ncbi:hypothetical protein G4G31_16725 [Massilia sp. Se16.2.3]|nr:hypothetical protein G4G31_16725 [Massilia sp. Se16.2.3]
MGRRICRRWARDCCCARSSSARAAWGRAGCAADFHFPDGSAHARRVRGLQRRTRLRAGHGGADLVVPAGAARPPGDDAVARFSVPDRRHGPRREPACRARAAARRAIAPVDPHRHPAAERIRRGAVPARNQRQRRRHPVADLQQHLSGAARHGRAPQRGRATPARAEIGRWQLAASAGRDYARVSGDWNPIHLAGWSARLMGLRAPIIHGMHTLGRACALLQARAGRPVTALSVRFRAPVALGSAVVLAEGAAPGEFMVLADGALAAEGHAAFAGNPGACR